MADQKITELTELTAPADADIVPIVDDPAGSPVTKKITRANLIGSKVRCRANMNDVDQSLTAGAETVINWAAEEYDTGGDFDLTNNKFVVPVTGYYLITANLRFSTGTDGDTLVVYIYKDATSVATGVGDFSSSTVQTVCVTDIVYLVAAEEIFIKAKNSNTNSSISGNTNESWVAIHQLSS